MAQSCLSLCNPMDCSMPGFPVHHLPGLVQTHIHWLSDAIQPSVIPFSSCLQSFPASGSFLESALCMFLFKFSYLWALVLTQTTTNILFELLTSIGHIYHSYRLWREAVEGRARTPLTHTCGHTQFPPETEQSTECFRMANPYEMCLEHLGQCLRSCSNYLGYHQ